MKHTTKLLVLVAAVIGALGIAGAGWAYWTAGGSGTASASVGTLNAPAIGTTTQPTAGVGTLRVNWAASTGTPAPTGYYVQRFVGSSLNGAACGSSPSTPVLAPSCDDTGLTASGPYNYKVTAVFRSWTAQSAASNAVSVVLDTTPPSVTVNQAAGQADPTKTSPVHFTATFSEAVHALPANGTGVVLGGTANHTSATIAVTTTDSSHYDIAVSDLTGDGTITAAFQAGATTDLAGNASLASTSTDNSVTYDTVAPAVSLSSTPTVNIANKSAVSASGTGENGASVSLVITDAGNAHSTSPATTTVSGGAWSVSGIDASGLADGPVTYKVTATDAAGNAATATQTALKDTVAPAAPTSVAIANGLGQGSAYINGTNAGSISYGVTIPANGGNATTDTVKVTLTSGASVNGQVASPGTPGGTVTVTGLNATSLTDGSVAVSAVVTDLAGNTSSAATATTTKDTAAPAPTSVTISNGGGTGSAFINNTNKASLSYDVTIPANGGNATTDTVKVTLTSGASVNGQVASPGTAGGTVTVTGLNATSLTDGSVAVSAVVTDLAGNTSASATTTNTKDTVAPATPTAVSLTNGGGSGNVYINSTNQAAVNYDVTNASNASGDIITVTLSSDVSGSPVSRTATRGATSPTSVNGINASGFGQGTVTATAKATDPAGNDSASTATTSNAKDTVAPAAPSTPDLADASDSGSSNTDNITKVITPTFAGTAEAGATVKVFDGVTQIGTGTATGGSYSIATAGIGTGSRTITATATDPAGNTSGTNSSLTVTIDTGAPSASAILTTNKTPGGTAGKAEAGDTVALTYSEAMSPASMLSGWDGSSRNVTVRITDGGGSSNDVLSVWDTTNTNQVPVGTIDLGAKVYVTGDVSFSASTITLSGSGVVTITLGTVSDSTKVATITNQNKATWTPSSTATDLAGNSASISAKQGSNLTQF